MHFMKELREAVNNQAAYARKLKETSGKKVIGYMCSYAPEEIIQAAGAHPMRLLGAQGNIVLADGHLQAYCCSLVRGVLEDALKRDLDFVDGMIFPHTCDSVQRLSDIWRLNVPYGFHLDVVLPVKLTGASARDYLIAVLQRFRNDLEAALQVKITDDDLRKSIILYNQIRRNLQRVYEAKNSNPAAISGQDIYVLLKAAMIMEKNHYLKLLKQVLQNIQAPGSPPSGKGPKRLVLAGGLCSLPDIYSAIETAGGTVVGDDLCTGSRNFSGMIKTTGNPLEALAARMLKRALCPAKHKDNAERAKNLLQIIGDTKADGVIFLLLKFCDPHAFDYPYLRDFLAAAGIPSLLLEVEDQTGAAGQLQTRIEAFLETI